MKKKPDPNSGSWTEDLKKLNIVSYFGFTVIGNVLVAGVIGYFLDQWTFQNRVIWVIFLFLGVFSGLVHGIKGLLLEEKRIKNKEESGTQNKGQS